MNLVQFTFHKSNIEKLNEYLVARQKKFSKPCHLLKFRKDENISTSCEHQVEKQQFWHLDSFGLLIYN